MNQSLLKSLIENEGTTEFAIYPAHVETSLPYHIPKSITDLKKQCPRGLVKATVLVNGQKWEEKVTFGCGGDKEHTHTRRNGVLVEFPLDAIRKDNETLTDTEKRARSTMHTEVLERADGQKIVRLVTSRQAIVVPWGEYALVEAERQKKADEQAARDAKLDEGLVAIRAPRHEDYNLSSTSDWHIRDYGMSPKREMSATERRERDYHEKNADLHGPFERWRNELTYGYFYGRIEIPLRHALKLGRILDIAEQNLLSDYAEGEDGDLDELKGLLDEIKDNRTVVEKKRKARSTK
jgi:hypothetical protein